MAMPEEAFADGREGDAANKSDGTGASACWRVFDDTWVTTVLVYFARSFKLHPLCKCIDAPILLWPSSSGQLEGLGLQ